MALVGTGFTRSIICLAILFHITGFCCSVLNIRALVLLFKYYTGSKFAFFSGVTIAGIPTGAMILPPIIEKLVTAYGFNGALLILGGIFLNMFPIGLVLRDPDREITAEREPLIDSIIGMHELNAENAHSSLPEEAGPISHVTFCEDLSEDSLLANGQHVESENTTSDTDDGSASVVGVIGRIWRNLHLGILAKEPLFCFVFLPTTWLLASTLCGWALFIILYAVSQGLDLALASLLATFGATGGLVANIIVSVLLRYRSEWSSQVLLVCIVISAAFFFLQLLYASFAYFMVTSFFIGSGLFGAAATVETVMLSIVQQSNVSDASSFLFLILGLGFLPSGYMAGSVYDMTNSVEMVYVLFGLMTIGAILLHVIVMICHHRRE